MQEFKNIWHALLSMFQYMTSGIDISPFYKSSNPEAATLLLVLYMFIMVRCFVCFQQDSLFRSVGNMQPSV